MIKIALSCAVGLFISGAAAHAAVAACDAPTAKRVWAKCSSCHVADPGAKSTLGPNLSGIIGRKAGTVAGYNYSPAMKKSGIIWTRQAFEDFVKAPQKMIPGTRMAFMGIKAPTDRTALSCALAKGKP